MIRLFRDSDLHSLRRMVHNTIHACYSGVYPDRAVQFFEEYHSKEKILERSRSGEILIVEREGAIVATGSLVGNEISGVFVSPDVQGQGYGKRIMRELESRAQEQGIPEVILSVSLPSRKFYENLDYEILSERSIDVGEGQVLNYWPARKIL